MISLVVIRNNARVGAEMARQVSGSGRRNQLLALPQPASGLAPVGFWLAPLGAASSTRWGLRLLVA